MERHVNTGKRNGSKAALQLDMALSLLLRLSLGIAFFEDLVEYLLGLFLTNLRNELARE